MDNQQAKVSEIEIGWVAGMFDGEGSCGFSIRPTDDKNGSPSITPFCTIGGTDVSGLNRLTSILDRAEIAYHVDWARPKGFTKSGRLFKKAWGMRISGHKRIKRFLVWIEPHIVIKKPQADGVMDYLNLRARHTDFRTPIQRDEMDCAIRVRGMNAKGFPVPTVQLNTSKVGASSEKLSQNGLKGAMARWHSDTSLND